MSIVCGRNGILCALCFSMHSILLFCSTGTRLAVMSVQDELNCSFGNASLHVWYAAVFVWNSQVSFWSKVKRAACINLLSSSFFYTQHQRHPLISSHTSTERTCYYGAGSTSKCVFNANFLPNRSDKRKQSGRIKAVGCWFESGWCVGPWRFLFCKFLTTVEAAEDY